MSVTNPHDKISSWGPKKKKTRHAESLFLHPPATGLGAFVELRSVMMKFRKEQQYCVTSGRDPSSSWVVTRKQHLGNLSSLGFASSPLGHGTRHLGVQYALCSPTKNLHAIRAFGPEPGTPYPLHALLWSSPRRRGHKSKSVQVTLPK